MKLIDLLKEIVIEPEGSEPVRTFTFSKRRLGAYSDDEFYLLRKAELMDYIQKTYRIRYFSYEDDDEELGNVTEDIVIYYNDFSDFINNIVIYSPRAARDKHLLQLIDNLGGEDYQAQDLDQLDEIIIEPESDLDDHEVTDLVSERVSEYIRSMARSISAVPSGDLSPDIFDDRPLYREVTSGGEVLVRPTAESMLPYKMKVLVLNFGSSDIDLSDYTTLKREILEYVAKHPVITVSGVYPGRRLEVGVDYWASMGVVYINFYWEYPS